MITKVKVIMWIELLGFMLFWGGGIWAMIGVALMLVAFLLLLRRYLKVWKKGKYTYLSGLGRINNYEEEENQKGWRRYWPF